MYVLDHDLTCKSVGRDDDGWKDPTLTVTDGAILDLNGHALACVNRNRDRGIKVVSATVRNGTVRGCLVGAVAYSAVVEGMTFSDNYAGVDSVFGSTISHNTAVKNTTGSAEMQGGGGNCLLSQRRD